MPALSIALAGLWIRGEDPRAFLAWAATLGVRAVQLDGTMPGLRARDLDRSARRDLSVQLRRAGLALTGIDLFIPPEHFLDPAHADRAAAALRGAIELASDLRDAARTGASPVVAVELPRLPVTPLPTARDGAANADSSIDPTAADALARASTVAPDESIERFAAQVADRLGVSIADHAWPPAPRAADGSIGVGIDPAALLAAGADPLAEIATLGSRIRSARISEALARSSSTASPRPIARNASGSRRSAVGFDLPLYAGALSAAGYRGPLVVDLRDTTEARAAAAGVIGRVQTSLSA